VFSSSHNHSQRYGNPFFKLDTYSSRMRVGQPFGWQKTSSWLHVRYACIVKTAWLQTCTFDAYKPFSSNFPIIQLWCWGLVRWGSAIREHSGKGCHNQKWPSHMHECYRRLTTVVIPCSPGLAQVWIEVSDSICVWLELKVVVTWVQQAWQFLLIVNGKLLTPSSAIPALIIEVAAY